MNIKAAFLALISSFTVGALPAAARPNTGNFDDHVRLYQTIQSHGVTVYFNHPKHCDGSIDGSYISVRRVLNVCQDRARPGQSETDWTANDLDTLRHEAHHMIQDCAGAGVANGHLVHLFSNRTELISFLDSVYSRSEQQSLMGGRSYSSHNRERQLIELEAFATAAVIDANSIADKMNEVCSR